MPWANAVPDPHAHLYGTVDPIDGIPYRKAELQPNAASHYRTIADRAVYTRAPQCHEVRIRFRGRLLYIGQYKTIRVARIARDQTYESLYGPDWEEILSTHAYRTRIYRDKIGLPPRKSKRRKKRQPKPERTRHKRKRKGNPE